MERNHNVMVPVPIPILMYHSVSNKVAPRFSKFAVTPQSFEAQLAYLQQSGYHSLTVSQMLQQVDTSATPEPKPVLLTFDDGFADFYEAAFPLLKKYNMVATLYIVTGAVGGTSHWLASEGEGQRPIVTWKQVRDLAANGVECGAHTHTHPPLDRLPRASARDEISRSKQALEDHLGQGVNSFAYPFGYFDDAVQEMVQSTGYLSACAVNYRMSSCHDDRFALSRYIVAGGLGLDAFAAILKGGFHIQINSRIRAEVWRIVRHRLPKIQTSSA